MATDLAGIDNENGYYPPAFMTSTLADEVNEAIERWSQEESDSEPPHKRVKSVANEYLQLLKRYRDASNRTNVIEVVRECREAVLGSLGIPPPNKNSEYEFIPSVSQVHDTENKCQVWIIEAPLPSKDAEITDLLALPYAKDQFDSKQIEAQKENLRTKDKFTESPLERIITEYIFKHDQRPRYVIVAAPKQLILIDRFKWPYKQILRFHLEEIFDRKEELTLNVFACFISRKALVPKSGVSLTERLEEESQRHANVVTSSLKRTVRDAIEILGNEVLQVCENKYPKGHPKQGTWIESKDLSQECLRFMYQLLFLFLVEANPKYDIIPLKDPAYNQGYSLESLRRLESIRLRTEEDKTGTYLWESLQILLRMMGQGVSRAEIPSQGKAFELPQMRVSLLDPDSTPILSNENVGLRNEAIQEIIRKLSLNQDKSGTGRISYVNLGIGQLGAVYETLIAFTGTVAKNDMLELVPFKNKKAAKVDIDDSGEEEENDDEGEVSDYSANDKVDLLAPSYFVEKSRAAEFKPEQIVYEGNNPKVYPKGSFIYRLAGRDRQKSASYYTPEPLARVLVKHTLMERCKGLRADELLDLKILEPAMGSAAFLVETTNQLAEMYLERKQEETGEQIPQNEYFYERQRVRSYIADRNCFGIDLNPIAIELGEVSLWLNGLHKSEFSPWFGDQLIAGNSLIGARRASYPVSQLGARKRADLWFNQKPVEIGWSKSRPKDHVWQFLLPDMDMAKFDRDKSIAGIAGEYQEQIKLWRRGGVFTAYDKEEIEQLLRLSEEVDVLFDIVADQLSNARKESNEEITVWPHPNENNCRRSDHLTKQRNLEQLTGSNSSAYSLPYKRLKTVMDAWCALWLWPLDQSHLLPCRREFLHGISAALIGNVGSEGTVEVPEVKYFPRHQASMIGQEEFILHHKTPQSLPPTEKQLIYETNIETLTESLEWIQVSTEVNKRERFTHFELYFADIMRDRGGFDIIIGNPPWIKPTWNPRQVLTSLDPSKYDLSPNQEKDAINKLRGTNVDEFIKEFTSSRGIISATASKNVMPFLGSGQNNYYRCFIDLSFRIVSLHGNTGLIHQDGHLGDPRAGNFRNHWYSRVVKNFDFVNKVKSKMFAECADGLLFSLNVYRGYKSKVSFDHITNLFLPSQIDDCYSTANAYSLPYIKNQTGNWDVRGHSQRLVKVNYDYLKIAHALTETGEKPVGQTSFVQAYSQDNQQILSKVSKFKCLNEAKNFSWFLSTLWDETNDRKKGIFVRDTKFCLPRNMIIQGPFFHVGNPLYKTPNRKCNNNQDYSELNLVQLPNRYLQRSNYVPNISSKEYRSRITSSRLNPNTKHTDYYRVAIRGMVSKHGIRRVISAIIPHDVAHVNSVKSIAFSDERAMLNFHSFSLSVIADFLFKIKNRSGIYSSDIEHFRWVALCDTAIHRGLRLACLTDAYSSLWNRQAQKCDPVRWSTSLPTRTIASDRDYLGDSDWNWASGLRSDFARRLALVEIDVLVAQAFGLSQSQLLEIYRIYFPVLEMHESATWYDCQGQIVWTSNNGLNGVGWRIDGGKKPSQNLWMKTLKKMSELPNEEQVLTCKVVDDTQPGGSRDAVRKFYGPFTKCDRIEDYKRAWKHFESLKGDTV